MSAHGEKTAMAAGCGRPCSRAASSVSEPVVHGQGPAAGAPGQLGRQVGAGPGGSGDVPAAVEVQHGGLRRVAGDGQLDGADSAEGHVGRGNVGRVRADHERLERLPVLGRALAQVERLGAHGRVDGISLLLAHVCS